MAKVYIDTLGCPKNQEDSERAAGLLVTAGHQIVRTEEEADVLLVNTCGFIEDARRESINRILELVPWKEAGKKMIISGCLTQRYGDALFAELPEADALLGVNDYGRLPEVVAGFGGDGIRDESQSEIKDGSRARALITDGREGLLTGPRLSLTGQGASRYLKVAEGCSNHCAYCAIPLIRGPYRSVPREEILREAARLAEEGAKELILIAQDVSAYGQDLYGGYELPALLRDLCRIPEIRWIRLMYCYEERITEQLIATLAEEEKICHYIDIPLQHCADSVLKAMKRRSTREHIDRNISLLRAAVPDIAIRTTLMTGFPGESEADFQALQSFVEQHRFERLGVFAFSPEEGTQAAEMPNQVPHEVAEARRESLMLRQLDISLANHQKWVGRTLEVLTEEIAEDGSYVGRSRYDAPEIDGSVLFTSATALQPGDMARVKITDALDYDLTGEAL
jgi:ribosomal protein S12 methylthiotransferase